MNNRRHHPKLNAALAGLAAATIAFTLVSCGSSDGGTSESPPPTAVGGSSVLPPVTAEISTIDGSTIAVRKGGTIDLIDPATTASDWTATIAAPTIVSFTPAHDDGSAKFNAGLLGDAVGETKVELTNSSTGDKVTFTVNVTAG